MTETSGPLEGEVGRYGRGLRVKHYGWCGGQKGGRASLPKPELIRDSRGRAGVKEEAGWHGVQKQEPRMGRAAVKGRRRAWGTTGIGDKVRWTTRVDTGGR